MRREQFEQEMYTLIAVYIDQALTEGSEEEGLSIGEGSKMLLKRKIALLADEADLAINRVLKADGSGNFYWQDGRFYTDKAHPSVPDTAIAITDQLWNDWYYAKEHPDEGSIIQRMDGQTLIEMQTFITSEDKKVHNVTHWITTTIPHTMKLFYFIPA